MNIVFWLNLNIPILRHSSYAYPWTMNIVHCAYIISQYSQPRESKKISVYQSYQNITRIFTKDVENLSNQNVQPFKHFYRWEFSSSFSQHFVWGYSIFCEIVTSVAPWSILFQDVLYSLEPVLLLLIYVFCFRMYFCFLIYFNTGCTVFCGTCTAAYWFILFQDVLYSVERLFLLREGAKKRGFVPYSGGDSTPLISYIILNIISNTTVGEVYHNHFFLI